MSALAYFDWLEDAIDRAELDAEEADAACFRARASQPAILGGSRRNESISVAPTNTPVVDCFGHPWRSRASRQPRLLLGVPFLV